MKKTHAIEPDSKLVRLQAELREAQQELVFAYRQFDEAVDPDLVESCIYQINSVKARCNYLIRAIKDCFPASAAAVAEAKGGVLWV